MPRNRVPSLCKHKGTGQHYVTLNGAAKTCRKCVPNTTTRPMRCASSVAELGLEVCTWIDGRS